MLFKKTFSLVGSNYVTHLKSLIFQLFLLALIVALFGLFFFDFGVNLVNAVREERLIEQTQTILSDLINWNGDNETKFLRDVDEFVYSITDIMASIPNFTQRMVFAVWFLIFAVYAIYFIAGTIQFTVAYSLNQFMSANIHTIFTWVFFKGFKEDSKITLISAFLCVLLDFGIAMTAIGAYVVFLSSLGMWGIIIAVIAFIILICLRKSLFAFLLPLYVNNEFNLKHAFKENNNMLFENFAKVFINTLLFGVVSVICVLLCLILFKVVVASILMILLSSFSSYALSCSYFVNYYEAIKKPYFTKKVKLPMENEEKTTETQLQE